MDAFPALQSPEYSNVLRLARLTGTVEASIDLDKNANVTNVTMTGMAPELLRKHT
jgi:hypothetical protein